MIAFVGKLFFQNGVIFDNTVVNQSKIFRFGIMRMGVGIARLAVRSPARMRNSDRAAEVFVLAKFFKVVNATASFVNT